MIKNHAFIDGNKRIGAISLVTFLDINGYRLTCTETEETAMVLRVAASEMDEAEWTAWVAGTLRLSGDSTGKCRSQFVAAAC